MDPRLVETLKERITFLEQEVDYQMQKYKELQERYWIKSDKYDALFEKWYKLATETLSQTEINKIKIEVPEPEPVQRKTRAKHSNRNLTDDQVREIKTSKEKGIDLAKKFGVTPPLISHIRTGKVYKDIK